ncbi:hypothetical protein CNMCM8927_006239 [Aspergillus lentulus]|uniref:Major facilitator superfamily (MFS) profile domain-containing protein n=1 Tax=Aspergillus lentulus TaxID=293939 RepID=A0AAN5YPB6_ASPLE|nr:hypothetical protein CNMCM6069_001394 [Aspergillus lentulus]KAF4174525.1 hypothetical protein CNMCM8060_008573 [Aspergillus lentulus]KAF4193466.1 hypothetical protein CNMCM8694_008811 [Aspergillus lentulus]KAF4205369.1 hypothetical protein CNMCM8927_006239 [Aspergillus lentulus]
MTILSSSSCIPSSMMRFVPAFRDAESKLRFKIDFFILTFCCITYFFNYLDRSNLSNAYVSGMKEELAFHGNQLNVINTIFTVGYILGQVPSNLALTYFRPRIFFPAMILLWGGLTMITAAVHSPQGIMAIRFFLGLAESSTFVGTHYILGSWYTEEELGKRSGIFTASGLAGTMFGGFIQTRIHSSLDGVRGLSGWRWLFIIDGLITLPIAIYGLLLFPDTPSTTLAPYLSESERALAISRLPVTNAERAPLNRAFIKHLFTTWYWWAFVILWVIAGETESFSSNSLLALYMKSHPTIKYTVAQLNNYPTGVPAVGIVSTLFWATLTDILHGKRYLVAYFIGITGVVTSVLILTRFDSTPTVFGAYYWAGAVYACQATFFAWCNDAMRSQDARHRSVVLASMNMGNNAVNAWWSIIFYSANLAPRFTRGMWAMIGCSIADDLTETFHTNVTGTHNATRSFLPLLREGRRKLVVNISTTLGSLTLAPVYKGSPTPAYKITKAALNMLTVQYAQDYGSEGFTFLAVSPGWLQTEMGGSRADLPPATGAKAVLDIVQKATPSQNGKALNIHVPGWEENEGLNQYDGKEVPW